MTGITEIAIGKTAAEFVRVEIGGSSIEEGADVLGVQQEDLGIVVDGFLEIFLARIGQAP
jgi:hypothetical protein